MSVQVHIERLVLDGLPVQPGDAALVQAAVEAELGRLLAESGMPPGWRQGGSQAQIPASILCLPPLPDAKALGVRVGREVYRALAGATCST